jgi:hypothetical protein
MSEDTPTYGPETPITATEVVIRQAIAPLQAQLAETISLLTNQSAPEPQHDKLFAALAEAQKTISNAEQDREVDAGKYAYQYATLASVMDAVRRPLAENGLSIIQITADQGEGMLGIRTILAHESGQSISDVIRMAPEKWDPRGIGSCRTYMRRYAVLAICGIAGAMDDDAEAATADPDDYERISKTQVDELLVLAENLFEKSADAVVDRMLDKVFQIKSAKDIPANLFDEACNLLKNQHKREQEQAKKKAAEKK